MKLTIPAVWIVALGLAIPVAAPKMLVAQEQHDRDDQDRARSGHDQDDRDRDNNRGYDNGREGYDRNPAYQAGYQDGINDGQNDRQSGHHMQPTRSHNYKRGDRGYESSFGDRDQYRQMYRQAYEQGYQQGYNGEGRYGDRVYNDRGYNRGHDADDRRRDDDHRRGEDQRHDDDHKDSDDHR